MDAFIAGHGAYVPPWRLPREQIAAVWGGPPVPGERAVAGRDEDTLTMAVEAALDCLSGLDTDSDAIDAVFFASTTPPYAEKHAAASVAAVLGCRRDVITTDVTDTLRAATSALRLAAQAVQGGSARTALVVASDARIGEPDSLSEQMLGDGAAAVLVGDTGAVRLSESAAVAADFLGPWRRTGESLVRSFEGKFETEYGCRRMLVEATEAVLERAGLRADEVSRFVLAAPDPRTARQAGGAFGYDSGEPHDDLFLQVGFTGAAHPLLCLGATIEAAVAGERLVLAAFGEGADAFVLDVEAAETRREGWRGVAGSIARRGSGGVYGDYLKSRELVEQVPSEMRASPVTYQRDLPRELPLIGARCESCGLVQYPGGRVCDGCGAYRSLVEHRLSRRGRIFTKTLDHIDQNCYLTTPIPRAVIDLDAGGRIFLDVTDCAPDEVETGQPVELTFRLFHDGGGYHNYYWKCRPLAQEV
ncbi:MAG: hypothetical protein JJLCMIEE_03303 [Acidimicrobiales bacterium]|nr:MAG: hydroxymethylglutaryl-CoA synthase family protein [Actinomycetota bacterium]MBV6510183.1 hypothetical protein [Acidimicrobiales bacterium]RIK02705.1 MAG: 3-hydroxy-3-methylglutaryl CoA synthase [Acidobacteriota bacterium]